MDLKTEIKKILSPPHDLFKIIHRFEELSKTEPNTLIQEADSWLLQLYELDPHFFGSFLRRHVSPNNPKLAETIYKRAEEDGHESIFRAFYVHAAPDEINQAIPQWIERKLSPEEIATRFRWRYRYPNNPILSEASCIALYNYDANIWEQFLLNDISYQHQNLSFEAGNFANFRALVNQNKQKAIAAQNQNLRQALFRRFATEPEKRAEIKQIIETASSLNKATQALNNYGLSPNEEDLEAIKQRFNFQTRLDSTAFFTFMIQYNEAFARTHIESEIAKATNESQLEEIVEQLRQQAWQRFYQLSDSWILRVYELAPNYCLSLVQGYYNQQIRMSNQTAAQLLQKVRQRSHREMLPFVYLYLYNAEEWNAAILNLAQSNLPQREIATGLEDLDCQPRYLYHGQSRAYLKDNVAEAVYRAASSHLHSFILPNLAPNNSYPLLLQAAEGTDDYYAIFREVATGDLWKEAMLNLLRHDFPAEEIVTELERYQLQRRSSSGNQRDVVMDAGVLKGFVAKYGEAVLPFFERYVSWVTAGRLKSLLALDIDRAELLRELNVIARREPQAFSSLSEIWAIPLYERGASFFESFIIRYIGRGNEYTSRQLLVRAKADKQLNLFRALYGLIVRGAEWEREISRFLETNPSQTDLADFLQLYDITNWDYLLSDNLSTKLYQHNPELAFPFIIRHLSRQQRWGHQASYDSLLKAAESNPEQHLTLLKQQAYEKYWKNQLEAMLKSTLNGEEALERLQLLHPRNTWEVQDTGILRQIFEKYGAAVAPYMVENIHWLRPDEDFMVKLEQNAPSSLFWEAVFATIGNHNNNGWSYRRWSRAVETLYKEDLSDTQVSASLQLLSPVQESRWRQYQISESVALNLYKKYPEASRGFIQNYYVPKFDNLDFFEEAKRQGDEELLDYLSYCAMSAINSLLYRAFPPHPQYQRPDKNAIKEIIEIGATISERFESLYQRDPNLYVRHVALTLAWWRPFTIWNAKGMEEHNPIYKYFASEHLSAWMESSDGIREVLESPNIFVQLIALKILTSQEHPNLSQRILENKRIFRQLLLGRARLSTKRLALRAIERAIAANPSAASELLPILEEAADFYGRLALSEQMMISITRIKYALEQGGIYAG